MANPQPWCTGPVHIYTFGLYLGTAERAPRRRLVQHYSPVMNDIGGTQVPFDVCYEGRESFVQCRLSRWNYAVLNQLFTISDSTKEGKDLPGDIGTLMLLEGKAFTLQLVYPYATSKPVAMAGMPTGFRYPATVLETEDDDPGTEAEYIDLSFHCYRSYDATTGTFLLYDNNVTGLANPT